MLRALTALALVAFAAASPLAEPQGLDFAAIAALPPAPTYTMATGVLAQTVSINQASLVSSIIVQASASPVVTTDDSYRRLRRQAIATCTGGSIQPVGAGPVSSPDTPVGFKANNYYGLVANAAATPSGWSQVFQNLNASNSAYGYLGYTVLPSYDTATCASKCEAITGCHAVNIYFERSPSVDPGTGIGCLDPPSTTLIKCVFWGAPLDTTTATNVGQWRRNFQVLIAGSNAYVNYNQSAVTGYSAATFLNNSAINAPGDCNGANTYMGVRLFNTGGFDISLCAAACSATSAYDIAHPPATGSPMVCSFFVTYLLYKNGAAQGQYCAMYNQTWESSYATNDGQWDQAGNHYTVGYSYAVSNAADPGTCIVAGTNGTSTLASRIRRLS